jgi:putative endonuclease
MKIYPAYYTYIVQCADGTLYTGLTNDLQLRLKQHNGLLSGGAKYTHYRRPVYLLYYEKFDNHKSAAQRECELKKLNRKQKENICNFPIIA